ncbi:BRI3-binding protein [Protopterus annectens]|uniref:BRI3-binding protein n=1 Tax=Protopterus annectens TaxID=7888 RepID=UPI001CFC262D|nr:BRI3-binding protein [Protopterus annectens]
MKGIDRLRFLMVALLFIAYFAWAEAARNRKEYSGQQNSFRRAAHSFHQALSSFIGEENLRAVQKFFSQITERFVQNVDVLVETVWRIWADLLEVLGIDASKMSHYFSPSAITNNPSRAVILVGTILLSYWFLSLLLGIFFYFLHTVFGRFFRIVRVVLFALSCLYILQKYESDLESAVLPLCVVVAVYFMTGPVGFYWRRGGSSSLEEKLDHLESQMRLLTIRLNRVIENLERVNEQ